MARSRDRTTSLPVRASSLSPPVHYRADHLLFQEGEDISEVWYLASGAVRVWAWGQEDPRLIAVRTPGWLIGAAPAIAGTRQVANVTTLIGCSLQRLAVADFHRLRREHGPFAEWLQHMLAQDACDQYQRTAALAGGHARAALESLLRQLFRTGSVLRRDASRRLDFGLSLTDWAALIGISRQWLHSLLKALTDEGAVANEKGWLVAPAGSPFAVVDDSGPTPPPL